jgi:hypothetical protein
MNTAEKFALDEHLSNYPQDATFDEVCEMIYTEDERVIVWANDPAPPYQSWRTSTAPNFTSKQWWRNC